MLADDASCSARNPYPGQIFNNPFNRVNLYGEEIEVDYRGNEVTVENFIRVLTGRLPPSTPRSKRLESDEESNILIFLSGHGGDGFLKFQDENELNSQELADAIEQMHQKNRNSDGIRVTASRVSGPRRYTFLCLHVDNGIGVYISDRYSYYAFEYLRAINTDSKKTMDSFLSICPPSACLSHVVVRSDLIQRPVSKIPVTDFLASVRSIQPGPTVRQSASINTSQEIPPSVEDGKESHFSHTPHHHRMHRAKEFVTSEWNYVDPFGF